MIRRDVLVENGSARWLLIDQVAHAQLAGALATAWWPAALGPPDFALDLLAATNHHDDGWIDWDRQPGVDARGRPVAFDEMELADSLAIWNRSITLAAARGPLIGYLVAGHFCRLLNRFDSWRREGPSGQAAISFLKQQDDNMVGGLAAWQSRDQPERTSKLAGRGVAFLQFWDALSLWLCCTERTETWTAGVSDGEQWTFAPVGWGRFVVKPWPWQAESLRVAAAGRCVPQASYQSVSQLAVAASEATEISWTFVAGSSSDPQH